MVNMQPTPTPAERHVVTIAQASIERPWCSERYLRRLIAERRIPFHKVGGRVLVDLADLDRLVEAGRIEPPMRRLHRT